MVGSECLAPRCPHLACHLTDALQIHSVGSQQMVSERILKSNALIGNDKALVRYLVVLQAGHDSKQYDNVCSL